MPQSILIVGNGVAGPVLATCLLLSPLPPSERPHITILERSSSPRIQGQNVDVRGAGVGVIRRLGLESSVRSSTTKEEGVEWVDSSNRTWCRLGADKSGKVQTATSDIEILRGRLAQLCYLKCKEVSDAAIARGERGVEFIFGDYIQDLQQDADKVTVRLAKSGKTQSYDLLIAADGLLSRTRRLAFGAAEDDAAQQRMGIWGGFFSLPRGPNDSLWRRWFHTTRSRGIMVRPHDDPSLSTVFMYVVNSSDSRFDSVADDGRKGLPEQKALLAEYFSDGGWECPRILQEMHKAEDFYYAPVAQIRFPDADGCPWAKGRVVLLGDAAYCASPISGMGTTLALTGAYHLAGALVEHGDDTAAAFAQYHAKMRPVVTKAQKLPLGGKGFHWTNPESTWGIFVLHCIIAFIYYSRIGKLIFMILGPPAGDSESIDDYGFRQL
ncbi:hypothetical protein ANO11243_035120 [Dothideomycetidae sp. 11243]|nr:hypothetical protein ANO11243_035120 [fungal sp. No.11243]